MTTRAFGTEATQRPRLKGTLRIRGDKSISHRALLLGAIAQGESQIRNLSSGEDVAATARILGQLGVCIHRAGDEWTIEGQGLTLSPHAKHYTLDCGNSGTSMRLLAGFLGRLPGLQATLIGDTSLHRRPMQRLIAPLKRMGVTLEALGEGERPPLKVQGAELQHHRHKLPIASAQVKSACLLAGLSCGVEVTEPRRSRDHTEQWLHYMGAPIERNGQRLTLGPTRTLRPFSLRIPGDSSSAAFFAVAASILPGSEITLKGVGLNPTRTGFIDVLNLMGADLELLHSDDAGPEAIGDLHIRSAQLSGVDISGELALRCLDEIPILAMAAAFAQGPSRFSDLGELRHKESDRIAQTVHGLTAMGVQAQQHPDGLHVIGGADMHHATLSAGMDHRIAMAFSVAGLASPAGLTIRDADSASSSYPEFYTHLEELRA